MGNAVVCTLFEGHYHYGVAALVNSLCKNGFSGTVYAGYRGSLPEWCKDARRDVQINWPYNKCLEITKEVKLVLVPVETSCHFTNYKPDFMLHLLNDVAKDAYAIFYFDPDIVIKCRWDFFRKWVSYGVAVVHENLYNDLPPTHPLRRTWAEIAINNNKPIVRQLASYISGGFCGITIRQKDFLENWSFFLKAGQQQYNVDLSKFHGYGRLDPFYFPDQDALNIALSSYEGEISEIGPDAMDFIPGGFVMSHATGSPKPWQKNFVMEALKANPPTKAEKEFWKNVSGPVKMFSELKTWLKKGSINMGAFIGRFYKRSAT